MNTEMSNNLIDCSKSLNGGANRHLPIGDAVGSFIPRHPVRIMASSLAIIMAFALAPSQFTGGSGAAWAACSRDTGGVTTATNTGTAGDDTFTCDVVNNPNSANISAGDGADNITLTGDGLTPTVTTVRSNAIYGGDGDNSITLEKGATTTYIFGGSGVDTVILDSATLTNATASRLLTYAGDDIIRIRNGSTVVLGGNAGVSAGDGNDKIYVDDSTVAGKAIFGNAGLDEFYITNGSSVNVVNGGADNDTISVDNSTIVGGVWGEAGDDTIALKNGSTTNAIIGGDGADTITLDNSTISHATPANARITGDNGNDIITVSGASSVYKVLGGNGDDEFTFTGGTITGLVDMGNGNDKVTITGGTATGPFGINLATGNDTFDMSGGTISVLHGDYSNGVGSDTITMSGGTITSNVILYSGENSFTMSGGTVSGNVGTHNDADTFVMSAGTIGGQVALGNGADTVTFSGGSIGTDVVLDHIDGTSNDVITVSGGSIGGDVISAGGNDTFDWTGGTVGGKIDLGLDSDTLTISSSGYDGSNILAGGEDVDPLDGEVDVLTMQGLTVAGAAVGSNITGWETFALDSTAITITGALTVGDLSVSNGSTLDGGTALAITGNTVIDATSAFTGFGGGAGAYSFGNLENNGLISTVDDQVGDAVTVNGDYSGTGELAFDVDLELGTADGITINGDVTGGPTNVSINNIGGTPGVVDFQLITVTGTSAVTDFALTGGPAQYGDYMYDLIGDGAGGWGVASTGLADQITSTYEVYPRVVMQPLIVFPTLHQRSFNRHQGATASSSVGNVIVSSKGDDIAEANWKDLNNGWVRAIYDTSHVVSGTGTYDVNTWLIEAGVDKVISENEDGYLVGGLLVRYGESSSFSPSETGGGVIDTTSVSLTGTLTWNSDDGYYIDSQAQGNWFASDITSMSTGALVEGNPGFGYGLSLEAGKLMRINDSTAFTPQLQLTYTEVGMDEFTSPGGEVVSVTNGETLTLRMGISVESDRDFGVANDDHHHHTYAIANVYHELSTGTVVNVDGTDLVNETAPWIGEIGFGTSYDWHQKNGNPAALFGELNVRTDLGNFGESYGLNLSAGINIGF